jgi:2-keto-4-pentenoate hydratase
MIKQEFIYGRREITPITGFYLDVNSIPKTLTDAYTSVRELVSGDPAFGSAWKLGGTTATTRATFGVALPYFGILHASEVMEAPSVAPGLPLIELKAEAEIALRLSNIIDHLTDISVLENTEPWSLFDAWCWSLELPSSPIRNLVECGVTALIADRCAAGALVLGAPRSRSIVEAGWDTKVLRLVEDGREIASGGISALIDPPELAAKSFLEQALIHGFKPRSGQWVATGGLTPCVNLKEGAWVSVFHGEEKVMAFEVRRWP